MSIRIHGEDIELLHFLMRREYESLMGRRSNQGAIERALLSSGSQLPRRAGDVSDVAMRASERLRHGRRRLGACTLEQIGVLQYAFGDGDTTGLGAFGEFPLVVLACPEAEALRLTHNDPRPLRVFLHGLAGTATQKGDGRQKRHAMQHLAELRTAAEERLVDALLAFGARVEGVVIPRTFTLRRLADAARVDRDSLKARLERCGLLDATQPRGKAFELSFRDVQTCLPDVAAKVVMRVVEERR